VYLIGVVLVSSTSAAGHGYRDFTWGFFSYFWRWGGDKTCAHHIATMADGHEREQCICVAMVDGHGREQCIYVAITVDSYALT
jgi:hypothetical protein